MQTNWGRGTRRRETRRRGARGRGTRDVGLGDVGLGDMDTGTQGRDKQTTPDICAKFVEYIFRWSRDSYHMLESLLV